VGDLHGGRRVAARRFFCVFLSRFSVVLRNICGRETENERGDGMATTYKTAGNISADDKGQTVYLDLQDVTPVAIMQGRHGYANGGQVYYEVAAADAGKVKDGEAVIVTTRGDSMVAAYLRDGHMEGGWAGSTLFSVTGRGKQYGAKVRLYGRPLTVVPAAQ
jgi:hypothetical protein